jgi:hypothetical protein
MCKRILSKEERKLGKQVRWTFDEPDLEISYRKLLAIGVPKSEAIKRVIGKEEIDKALLQPVVTSSGRIF